MKFYVGVTDNNWFQFLSERSPEEVNFWRPKNQNDFERDLGNRWHFFLDNRWGWAAGAVGLGNYSDFVCGILA